MIPKFKAWLKNEKRMIEVEEISFIGQKQIAYTETEYRYTDKEPFYYTQWIDFDDIELLQYIGRKDKNKIEIYENYIVKLPAYLTNYTEYAICKWIDNRFSIEDVIGFGFVDLKGKKVRSDEWEDFEVIGNIYENPELLGGNNNE